MPHSENGSLNRVHKNPRQTAKEDGPLYIANVGVFKGPSRIIGPPAYR